MGSTNSKSFLQINSGSSQRRARARTVPAFSHVQQLKSEGASKAVRTRHTIAYAPNPHCTHSHNSSLIDMMVHRERLTSSDENQHDHVEDYVARYDGSDRDVQPRTQRLHSEEGCRPLLHWESFIEDYDLCRDDDASLSQSVNPLTVSSTATSFLSLVAPFAARTHSLMYRVESKPALMEFLMPVRNGEEEEASLTPGGVAGVSVTSVSPAVSRRYSSIIYNSDSSLSSISEDNDDDVSDDTSRGVRRGSSIVSLHLTEEQELELAVEKGFTAEQIGAARTICERPSLLRASTDCSPFSASTSTSAALESILLRVPSDTAEGVAGLAQIPLQPRASLKSPLWRSPSRSTRMRPRRLQPLRSFRPQTRRLNNRSHSLLVEVVSEAPMYHLHDRTPLSMSITESVFRDIDDDDDDAVERSIMNAACAVVPAAVERSSAGSFPVSQGSQHGSFKRTLAAAADSASVTAANPFTSAIATDASYVEVFADVSD